MTDNLTFNVWILDMTRNGKFIVLLKSGALVTMIVQKVKNAIVDSASTHVDLQLTLALHLLFARRFLTLRLACALKELPVFP